MSDVIQLLPDNIANQIAAGEVIQRPASAVKELLENAVDAGATEIKLSVLDAGKTLLQVADDGKGMSETDARLCFERHATSKIRKIDDLFHIRTMGFRGEALASIAAVAQVELKTKRLQDDAGTFIEIDDSIVRRQEPVAMTNGTVISMKNLFFNVPARRNFLKSNPSEMRHIIDEFIRVSMAFPEVFFSLTSNGQQIFYLEKGSLKQRIVQIMGSGLEAKLVSVNEKTDYLDITGFIGKPQAAKKTRGDQYFFVNGRFIRNAYLNHAVMKAFDKLLPSDSYPLYVLFITLDPGQVDINVHPTKQEIKFEDERIVYAFVESAVKHALAQFSITPTLDFELDAGIQQSSAVAHPEQAAIDRAATGSPLFKSFADKARAHYIENKSELKHWKDFYRKESRERSPALPDEKFTPLFVPKSETEVPEDLFLLHNTFIIAPNPQGYMLVHQQNASERVVYEKLSAVFESQTPVTQKSLFPETMQLSPADAALLGELLPDLNRIGYSIEDFGKNTFILHGTPANLRAGNDIEVIEKLLEQYKHYSTDLNYSSREKILRAIAMQKSIKAGISLTKPEMQNLLRDLFDCKVYNTTPNGKPVFLNFDKTELNNMFGR